MRSLPSTSAVRRNIANPRSGGGATLRETAILRFQLRDQLNQRPVLIPQIEDLLDLLRAHKGIDVVEIFPRPLWQTVDTLSCDLQEWAGSPTGHKLFDLASILPCVRAHGRLKRVPHGLCALGGAAERRVVAAGGSTLF